VAKRVNLFFLYLKELLSYSIFSLWDFLITCYFPFFKESKADQQSQQAQQPQPNGVAAAGTSAVASKEAQPPSDVLDQYRFILLIRNQLMQTTPFKNIEEYNKNELKHKKFKQTYENLRFHYTELMSLLDNLSMEAKTVTDIYKENV
jgi:hypothetical protein